MKTLSNLYEAPTDLSKWLETISPPFEISKNWKPLYFIAMTARSGSTMLCSTIKKLEQLGSPDEYLNPRGPFQMYHSKFGGETFAEYLNNIFNQTHPKGEMLGIKTAFLDFYPLASRFNEEFVEFSNFIYLTRINIYSQAVSLWSANKTQLWHSYGGTRSRISLSDYNYIEILNCFTQLLDERVKWEAYFALQGISPHRITYENLCANQESVLRSIVNFLGVEVCDKIILGSKPETAALATDVQNEIIFRFKKDFISHRETNKYFEKSIF